MALGGDTDARYPTNQGVDEWYGILRSSDRAFWQNSSSYDPDSHSDLGYVHIMAASRIKTPQKLAVYDRSKRRTIDRDITDKAINFIKQKANKQQSFFAFISYTKTHEPVDPHPEFRGKTKNGDFADVLAQTDAYVGELLGTIDEIGIKDRTIFIFTSDNGREGVPRSFGFTGPWRGSMFSPYEGSLRVPFLIRWPGIIPKNQVSNEIFHQIDLFPTLASFVNAAVPNDRIIDGRDQSLFLKGKTDNSARDSMVIYIGNELFGAKWRNWKILIKEMSDDGYGVKKMAYPSIYNLIVDPKEEVPELNYLDNTWVDFPLYQVLEDHKLSLEKDPGTPDP